MRRRLTTGFIPDRTIRSLKHDRHRHGTLQALNKTTTLNLLVGCTCLTYPTPSSISISDNREVAEQQRTHPVVHMSFARHRGDSLLIPGQGMQHGDLLRDFHNCIMQSHPGPRGCNTSRTTTSTNHSISGFHHHSSLVCSHLHHLGATSSSSTATSASITRGRGRISMPIEAMLFCKKEIAVNA